MAINRKARFRPGSIHPSFIKSNTGLLIDENTGELSGELLIAQDNLLDIKIDDLYWKDPIQTTNAFEGTNPEDYRIGEAYFSIIENNIYIYIGDTSLASNDRSIYQPQSWITANQTERFLIVSAGVDADTWASREYVDQEIANLIGGAPEVLSTLNDLVTAINNDPNFGATILADLANLQQNKADIDDVYTKDEIDSLEITINDRIENAVDRFANTVDYVCGPNQDDDDIDFGNLWTTTKLNVSSANPKNYLIKQNITSPETPPVEFDRANAHIVGLHVPKKEYAFSHIQNVIVRIREDDSLNPLAFTNIKFNRFFIESDSASFVGIFKGCIFQEAESFAHVLENQNSGNILYFEDCIFLCNEDYISLTSSEVYFNNCIFESEQSLKILSLSAITKGYINNSKLLGFIDLDDTDLFSIEKTYIELTTDNPFIDVNENSTLLLQRITFSTPEVYTSNYVSGTGTVYFDYNIVDISLKPVPQPESRVKQPLVADTLNSGAGADIYHFFDPLGSENFFYNDEKARDSIANMLLNSSHSPVFTWTYDDVNNRLNLTLSIQSSDLTDSANIAYLDANNTFTQNNIFQNISAANISADSINSDSISSPVITTTTALQTTNDTSVATTEYVRTAITELTAQLFTTELNELSDVSITNPEQNQVLLYQGGNDPEAQWVNGRISSTALSDAEGLIRENDSVFKLSRIDEPLRSNQVGNGIFTGGYTSENQILAWNGEYVDLPTGVPGDGAYVPVLSNQVLLYATTQTANQTYDGAGKIWIADTQEVQDGSVNNKAVAPEDLYKNYLRTDASNINNQAKTTLRLNLNISEDFAEIDGANITAPSTFRFNLNFPAEMSQGDILEALDTESYSHVKRTLSYNKYYNLDYATDASVASRPNTLEEYYVADTEGTIFYNVSTEANQTSYLVLPSLTGGYTFLSHDQDYSNLSKDRIGPIKIRKVNGSTHADAGTLSIICATDSDRIITADNVLIDTNPALDRSEAQIDLLQENHTVLLWPCEDESGKFWFVDGYYYNSADQTQPVTEIQVSPEAVQDAIEGFFDHNFHSSSIAVAYDDPNHRMVLTQYFATQQQVNAGTISDLPVAPDTLKSLTDTIVSNAAAAYVTKANNLSDLEDVAIARDNLSLGTLALLDSGTLPGEVPIIASTLSQGFVYYDSGLKVEALPVASTIQNGLVELATLNEAETKTNPTAVVTVETLHDILLTTNTYTNTVKALVNSLLYVPSNTILINAQLNNYYSLSTANGSITFNLPEITNQALGSLIKIKFRKKQADQDTITISAFTNQTIDNSTQPYVLDVEGQVIEFVLGFDGWEIN